MPISPSVHAAVRELADQPLVPMLDADLIATTEDLYKLITQINAQALRCLAEIEDRDLAPDAGAPTTAAWLVARLRMNDGPARHQVRSATALARHPHTAAALADADATITPEHAHVITTAIDTLPPSVDAATLQAAQATLVAEAAALTARQLVRVGPGLHTALDPDGPQPDDQDRPDPGYYLNLRSRDDGSTQGQFWLDPALGLHLATLIQAGAAPHPSTTAGADPRTPGRRRHHALADLLRRAVAHPDPVPGTGRPTLAVTVSLADLRAGLPAHGPDHTRIDPGTVRRMACDAAIIPIVLGSPSEILDIGRRTRTVPAGIRRALILRDRGCAFPGCDRPPSWTDAHHIRHWSQGGKTAVSNLVLLCEHHHTTIHHRGWTVRLDHHGQPAFTPPHWLQPADHHAA